jgi:hypothetical protein
MLPGEEACSSWANVIAYAERLGSREALLALWNELARVRGELLRVTMPAARATEQQGTTEDALLSAPQQAVAADVQQVLHSRDATIWRLTADAAAYAACLEQLFAHVDAVLAASSPSSDEWIRTREELTARLAKHATLMKLASVAATPQHTHHDHSPHAAAQSAETHHGAVSEAASSPATARAPSPLVHHAPQHVDTSLLASPMPSARLPDPSTAAPADLTPEARLATAERRVAELEATLKAARKENKDLRRLGQSLHAQLKASAPRLPPA